MDVRQMEVATRVPAKEKQEKMSQLLLPKTVSAEAKRFFLKKNRACARHLISSVS
jgi:hypothetical protein